MPESPLSALLAADSDCVIDFVSRRTPAPVLAARAGRLAGGLLGLGLAPGARVALFLPNTPSALAVMFACLEAGLRPAVLDPRASAEELEAQLRATAPAAFITLDPVRLFAKAWDLLPACPNARLIVGRFADELPRLRGLLLPLVRGGGTATMPEGAAVVPLRALDAPPPDVPGAVAEILLGSGSYDAADLLARAAVIPRPGPRERWLLGHPLASAEGLAVVLAALAGPVDLLLSAQLGERHLARLARKAAVTRTFAPA